jgi:hypothetical protein
MKRDDMVLSLKQLFVPTLRERGFKGSFPHFRLPLKDHIDLLTVQFNKWGGGFVIEISHCAPEESRNLGVCTSRRIELERGTLSTNFQDLVLLAPVKMAIGSGSTMERPPTKLPDRLFRIWLRLTSGGKVNGHRRNIAQNFHLGGRTKSAGLSKRLFSTVVVLTPFASKAFGG